jgi:hypothetical protein
MNLLPRPYFAAAVGQESHVLIRLQALAFKYIKPGGIRVTEERELFQLQAYSAKIPVATRAVLEASRRLHRPVDALSIEDVERVEEGIH